MKCERVVNLMTQLSTMWLCEFTTHVDLSHSGKGEESVIFLLLNRTLCLVSQGILIHQFFSRNLDMRAFW